MRRLMLLSCLSLAAAPMCGHASPRFTTAAITVSQAWVRAIPAPGDASGYLTIDNAGDADTLEGISCTGALGATMNEPNAKTGSAGLMAPLGTNLMPILLQVPIPAHGHVVFKPGGRYMKFESMATALQTGTLVSCTLTFSANGPLDVQFVVAPPDATSPPQ